MYHIHRIRMIIRHKEPILFLILLYTFRLPFFTPMRQPSRIDLPSKQITLLFKSPNIIKLNLGYSIINPNIGSIPMTFLYILNPINIILCTLYFEVEPYFAECFDIRFICPVEPVLILYLEKDNRTFWVRWCVHVFINYWYQRLEIYFYFLQERTIICTDN